MPLPDPLAVSPVARSLAPGALEALGDPRQQAFQRALAGQLGKSMQGEVLARLTDGSFVVRVAGTPARMQLPAGAQVGAEVPLTLVAAQPRPTFQVGPGGDAPATFTEAHATLADLAQDAPGTPDAAARAPLARAGALPATAAALAAASVRPDGAAVQASLSPAARAIGGILAEALKADVPARAIAGSAPLAPAPGADPRQLAAALQQSLATSGLFYESHLAEWAAGTRTLAELSAEPQMQAARGAAPAGHETAQLVNLQLATHEQSQLAWHGLAWPGQPLLLELRREPSGREAPEGGGDAREDGDTWHSRMRLRFAALGEISASIALAGQQVHLRLEAASEPAGELLRAHAARLADALGAAGADLASLAIHAAKQADD